MRSHWIDGRPTTGKRSAIAVLDPATGALVDSVARGTADDADRAVRAARAAFPGWRFVPGVEKAAMLHEVARRMRARHHELATTMTREGGKPYCENHDEVEWSAACFDYYAEVGRDARGSSIPPVAPHQVNFTIKEPYGVVAAIVPWNYPLLLMSWKVAPALAAGNTVVVKPSEETPLATLDLAAAFAALPRGTVNIVNGLGGEVGEALVTHPGVDLVALTGALATGQRVGELCAREIKKCHLELGGNDPFIVFPDADLEVAAKGAVWAAFLNAGQVCTSGKRYFIFEEIYDEFVARAVKFTKSLRLGHGLDPKTDIGPLINARQLADVEARVAEAVADGARVLTGGKRSRKFPNGFFFEPTILVDVRPEMRIVATETFGPTMPIQKVARPRRGDRARQRPGVRPRRQHLHQQHGVGDDRDGAHHRRHLLDQRPAHRQRGRPVRRHEEDRPLARARGGRLGRVPRDQARPPRLEAGGEAVLVSVREVQQAALMMGAAAPPIPRLAISC